LLVEIGERVESFHSISVTIFLFRDSLKHIASELTGGQLLFLLLQLPLGLLGLRFKYVSLQSGSFFFKSILFGLAEEGSFAPNIR